MTITRPRSRKAQQCVCLAIVFFSIAALIPLASVRGNGVIVSGGLVNMRVNNQRHQLYVASQSDNAVLVVSMSTNRILTSIPVGPRPFGMDVSSDGKELYVALRGTKALAVVNLTSLTFSRTIPLTTVPVDVAAGVQGRAYVTSDDYWGYPRIVDTANNVELAIINDTGYRPIYYGALARISPDRRSFYVGETGLSSGTFYKFSVQTDKGRLLASSVFEADNLGDFAVSPDGLSGYAAAAAPYFVSVFATSDLSLVGQLSTGSYPNSVSLARNGKVAFATHDSYEVIAFNTTNHSVINRYPLAHEAIQVRSTEDGSNIYALTGDIYGSRDLEVIDTIPPSWPSGSHLNAVAINSSSILLSWTSAADNVGITNYEIYENNKLLSTTPGNSTTYTVAGVCGSTSYSFRVEASDSTSSTTTGPNANVTTPYRSPDFSLTLSPTVQAAEAGWTYNVDSATVSSNCGFSGTVDLSTSTSPPTPKSPTGILIDPRLQISAGESATSIIAILSDVSTPVGNYTLTVTATSGSLSTSASMTVMITPPRPAPPPPPSSPPTTQPGQARLLYQGFLSGAFHNGQAGVIINKFTNQGSVPVRVTSLTVDGDLGTFSLTTGLPLWLNATASATMNLTINVPTYALPGNHTIAVTVGWEYYNPYTSAWQTGSSIVSNGNIRVQGPSVAEAVTNLAGVLRAHESQLLIGFVSYVSIMAAATLLVVWHDNSALNRRRRSL